MTIKMHEILSFPQFYNAIKDKKLPIQIAYKLSKLVKIIDENIQFYTDNMSKIIGAYAERDSEGKFVYTDDSRAAIKIQEDKVTICQEELAFLNEVEVDLGEINLTIEDFGSVDLTMAELQGILPLIGG